MLLCGRNERLLRCLHRRDDLLRGVGEVAGAGDLEAACGKGRFAGFDVVAFETDDERDAERDFLRSSDDAVGDDVAVHDATEDVDEDTFDLGIAQDDFEGCRDLFFRRAAADVEEVGGFAAVELDDVHGGHGETSTIDEAGDVAVESDVVESEFAGSDFAGIFFGGVTHGGDVFLTIEGVVVEVELGIECDDFVFGGDCERIDLDEGAVGFEVKIPQGGEEFHGLVHLRAAQTKGCGDLAALVGLQANAGMDELFADLLGSLLGDFFDVHAAFGGGDDGVAAGAAIEEDGEVVFLGNVNGLGDEDFAHELAFRAGLMSDKGLAKHLAGDVLRFFGCLDEMYAAFEAVLEGAFATATGMNLSFDDESTCTDFACGGARFLRCAGDDAFRTGDAEFFKQLLGLILVDVHGGKLGNCDSRSATRSVKAHSLGKRECRACCSGKAEA